MKKVLSRRCCRRLVLAGVAESSAACTNTGGFDRWLSQFKAEARKEASRPAQSPRSTA